MLDKLNKIFRNMQNLELQPTDYNVGLLDEAYRKIKELAGEIVQAQELIRKLEQKTEGGEEKTEPEAGGPEDGDGKTEPEAGDGRTEPEDGGPETGDGRTEPEDGGPEAGDVNG